MGGGNGHRATELDRRAETLSILRGQGLERPAVDLRLAERARAALESAAAEHIDDVPDGAVVRVNKSRLSQVLRCEGNLVAELAAAGDRRESPGSVAGQLLDHLFAQVAVGVPVGDDPVRDGLAAAEVGGNDRLAPAWDALDPDERDEVRARVATALAQLAAMWPKLPPSALLRLQEPMTVELAAGRVICAGRVDAVVGSDRLVRNEHGQEELHVGVTLFDLKSGARRGDDLADATWYGLLETLRRDVPPFQVGNLYLTNGVLELVPFDADRLDRAVERTADGLSRLVGLAAGRSPELTPNPLCDWCPAASSCPRAGEWAAGREEFA